MEWTEEAIAKLSSAWAEGLSTAEIGRQMGISKNAVVGKAHRLNLTSRPSPIRRDTERTPRRRLPRRSVGPTLPALAASIAPMLPDVVEPDTAEPAPAPVTERAPPVLRSVPVQRPVVRVTPCCWPIGEPGTRSFRFCDLAAMTGKPYCEEHAALAYVKVRDRREDAA
jgi:GcrA cell cycle regulator